MPKFHVSADGNPRPCSATDGACPLSEADGSPTPHGEFASAQEASAFAEAVNAKRFGGSFAAVKRGPDRAQIAPAFSQTVLDGTSADLDNGIYSDDAEFEDFGSDYQEFRDSVSDVDGYQLELTTVTEVFDDEGNTLSQEERYERSTFNDEAGRLDMVKGSLGTDGVSAFEQGGAVALERWDTPNKRVSYRLASRNMGV